jgi:hypothetical protein
MFLSMRKAGTIFAGQIAVHRILLRDDEIVGYQRLLPTTRPHLLTSVLSDLCRTKAPRGPRIAEWTRFRVAPSHRESRPRSNGVFLELAQGVVEWGMSANVDIVTVATDWRLMVIAMQLRLFCSPARISGSLRSRPAPPDPACGRPVSPRSLRRPSRRAPIPPRPDATGPRVRGRTRRNRGLRERRKNASVAALGDSRETM